MDIPLTADEIRSYADRVLVAPGGGAADQVEVIAALEELKSAVCAAQAQAAVAFDVQRRAEQARAGVRADRQGRGTAAEIALARRESPHRGQSLLGLGKILVAEMPHTLARLRDGSLNEFRATLLARETGCLSAEQRAFVDEELCADPRALHGVGTRELLGRVRRMAAELDPAAVARRARRAEADRNVTVRPAPDTMAYLTGLMPVAQAVAAYASVRAAALSARAQGDQRSLGQLMSDLMLARMTGLPDTGGGEHAPAVPLTINLTMSDETLAGGHAPAVLSGDGVAGEVVPAEVARHLAAQASGSGAAVWFRRLYRNRLGRLVAMTSRQRLFPDGIAELLALQGLGICASPYCDAPVRHTDHIQPADEGGATSAANGQGLCEACNHAKQAPGWRQRVVSSPRERPEVETVTPTGHRYAATAPAPPGWREPRFVQVGPGRYGLIA
ncbi:DUF222 domain-containing protein [Nocardioides carbamazepini]|uniref:HNH endonuclease n=1 Tax=Nocardioides carbamazepini TaxID=2854259 RepID=UPI00214A69FA|nr:DUF222 domain-containing protein [Nocardioides carbamazepini]MCR1780980.1 DUF222 domain-containing protein [Nocardioides carbamazepini]